MVSWPFIEEHFSILVSTDTACLIRFGLLTRRIIVRYIINNILIDNISIAFRYILNAHFPMLFKWCGVKALAFFAELLDLFWQLLYCIVRALRKLHLALISFSFDNSCAG